MIRNSALRAGPPLAACSVVAAAAYERTPACCPVQTCRHSLPRRTRSCSRAWSVRGGSAESSAAAWLVCGAACADLPAAPGLTAARACVPGAGGSAAAASHAHVEARRAARPRRRCASRGGGRAAGPGQPQAAAAAWHGRARPRERRCALLMPAVAERSCRHCTAFTHCLKACHSSNSTVQAWQLGRPGWYRAGTSAQDPSQGSTASEQCGLGMYGYSAAGPVQRCVASRGVLLGILTAAAHPATAGAALCWDAGDACFGRAQLHAWKCSPD